MTFLIPIAEMLGSDPVSLVVLGTLSAACAFYMQTLSAKPWLGVVAFPILLASGLLAHDAAVALGIYPPLPPNPGVIVDGLPNVLVAGLIGMTVAGLALIGALRRF